MDKRVIFLQAYIFIGLFFSSCGTGCGHYNYYCKEDDFSFSIIDQKDSSLLIFDNTDTVVYSRCLRGIYCNVEFMIPDSSKTIFLNNQYQEIIRVIPHAYQIELVDVHAFNSVEERLMVSGGFSGYYGGYERGDRYGFFFCRNGEFVHGMRPLE